MLDATEKIVSLRKVARGLGGTDARLWRYKDIPAIVYGPPPSGMGSTDEHVTLEHFFHTIKCHVLSAYDYMSKNPLP